MICMGCKYSDMPYPGFIDCHIGCYPYYDEEQETEVCAGFQRRRTKEEIERSGQSRNTITERTMD